MIRIQSTQEILAQSLIELLTQHCFSKISINKIVENCSLSRRTFYNYFSDIYDLVEWIYNNDDWFVGPKKWQEYDDYGQSTYNKLVVMKKNCNFYAKTLQDPLCKNIFCQHIKARALYWIKQRHTLDKNTTFVVDFVCHGFSDELVKWLSTGAKHTPAEIWEFFMECLPISFFNITLKDVKSPIVNKVNVDEVLEEECV